MKKKRKKKKGAVSLAPPPPGARRQKAADFDELLHTQIFFSWLTLCIDADRTLRDLKVGIFITQKRDIFEI
jgi:hypothetical protein